MGKKWHGNKKPLVSRSGHKLMQYKTSWEPVAEWYGRYMSLSGTLQKDIVFPKTMALLEPRRGGRYLDIACGEGTFSRQLTAHAKGADVVGIDIASSLIERAKKQAPPGAEYRIADATKFAHLFPAASFDGATCILAIQNIELFEKVFAEVIKGLKPSAPFVLVMNHPAFRQPRQSGWGWDEKRKLQYRRVDKYLSAYDAPITAHPGSAPHVKTFSYHRPLQEYTAALIRNGFVITALEEWISNRVSKPGARAKAENTAREEIPMFLALRAEKI